MLEKKNFILRFRYVFIILPIVLSLVSIYFIRFLTPSMRSMDFVPTSHPFFEVHKKLSEKFGGLNMVNIAIEVKNGTILNPETLKKVKFIFEEVSMLDEVNPRRVLSIYSRQIKRVRVYKDGFEVKRFLRSVPTTRLGLARLKSEILRNPIVYGPLVSRDFKSTIIKAEFREDVPSTAIYEKVMGIIEKYRDKNHRIYVSGVPILEGYVQSHLGYIVYIFLTASAVVLILLYWAFGKKRGFFLPLLSSGMSVLMTLGVMGVFHFPLNPFTVLVPFLIFMVAISHSVQFIERYFELSSQGMKGESLMSGVLSSLLSPVRASLFTDFLGFFSLYFIPIPSIRYMAVAGGLGILSIFLTVVLFLPGAFSIVVPPEFSFGRGDNGIISKIMGFFSRAYRHRFAIFLVTSIFIVFSVLGLKRLVVGETEPGSSLLFRDAPYNVAERFIDREFLGSVPYYVLVDGGKEDSLVRASAIKLVDSLESHLRKVPGVGYGFSIADYMKMMNMLVGGSFKYYRVPDRDGAIGEYLFLLESNSFPGVFSAIIDPSHRFANIRLDLSDCGYSTLRRVVSETRSWEEKNSELLKKTGVSFLYAGGAAGLRAATDEVIEKGFLRTIAIIFLLIFIRVSYGVNSLVGGLFLLVPLFLSVLFTFGGFGVLGIPLTLATLPVAAIGPGLGIDYGIYLASRIKEEAESGLNLEDAIKKALMTCGKAVFFTGSILTIGVSFWLFSNLKIQAKLGGALGLLIILSMLSVLTFFPAFLSLVRPKFLKGGGRP